MTFHLCKGSATFHIKMRDLRSPATFIIFLSPTSRRHKENLWRSDGGKGLWQSLPCIPMYTILPVISFKLASEAYHFPLFSQDRILHYLLFIV